MVSILFPQGVSGLIFAVVCAFARVAKTSFANLSYSAYIGSGTPFPTEGQLSERVAI